ncbi:adenine deaminase [Fructobacillus pseudoficulneus]|uniref:Adenine deaminase n=1 Tax=Fructobacillus pseudoficulneus TaxID=220714 RepID=A0A3F3H6W1_9LACO|nr:adenine deaminase [Fructobacillus pseudoficulneus]GAP02263.1 adenine deaminase [Fructobacillus pseudoficulneus]SEH36228.1 Adenine deaminase [Fructobacillus pseudoficulneus]
MSQTVDYRLHGGQVLNVFNQEFVKEDVWIKDQQIVYLGDDNDDLVAQTTIDCQGQFIVPGLIDAHLHIESSLLTPSEFGRLSLQNGVTRIFADPHEIASVAGVSGIQYMLDSAKKTPLHIHYMLPSSVPATPFEHAGATLDADALKPFYQHPEIAGLAEVMDYPAVANGDADMLQKIQDAQDAHRHVDGHGAGLGPAELATYRAFGIDTDHEATSKEEALDRVNAGMAVFLREGTVERDELALLPAITAANQGHFAFATDDKSAADIQKEGSINFNVALAIKNGMKPELAYTLASYNAAMAHHLQNVGAIAPGFVADLLILNDPATIDIKDVMVAGKFFQNQKEPVLLLPGQQINLTFSQADLALALDASKPAHVIEIEPHHITTKHQVEMVPVNAEGRFVANQTYAKVAVIERYHDLGHGLGILKGLDLKAGAIASTIAHDSHNLIVAGVDDADMALAVQTLKEIGGGQVVVHQGQVTTLPLPIGGLMSDLPFEELIQKQDELNSAFAQISDLAFDPFLTLSFMALPVIPSLKITDQGLFDFDQFSFIKIQD